MYESVDASVRCKLASPMFKDNYSMRAMHDDLPPTNFRHELGRKLDFRYGACLGYGAWEV